jgi:hypothetical protein
MKSARNVKGQEMVSKAETKRTPSLWHCVAAFVCASIAGIVLGTVTEGVIYRNFPPPLKLIEMLLISPIAITFGGSHFSSDELRIPLGLLGFTYPFWTIYSFLFLIAWRKWWCLVLLFGIQLAFGFGLIHKVLGMLSVT